MKGRARRRRTSFEEQHTDTHWSKEDVFALVFDLGASELRVGYAGDDTPQYVVPTVRKEERKRGEKKKVKVKVKN